MASTPLSIRFDPELLDRLRRRAATRDSTPSGLAQRLVDEGLRSLDHPGIVFRDGPSGRRAGLIDGPDIWEVAVATRDDDAKQALASFGLSQPRLTAALSYYVAYRNEIDAEIAENERAADEAFRSWQAQQQLLA